MSMTKRTICIDDSEDDDNICILVSINNEPEEATYITKETFEVLFGEIVIDGLVLELNINNITKERRAKAKSTYDKLIAKEGLVRR